MRYNKTVINVASVGVITVLLFGSLVLGLAEPVSSKIDQSSVVTVTNGMTANEIGQLLYEHGIIKNVILFRVIAKTEHMDSNFQAGEYVFSSDMPVKKIIAILAKGETTNQQITIPEGFTTNQIASLIEEKHLGSSEQFKKSARNFAPYDYMILKDGTTYRPEGYLFPDTYRIPKGATEEQILSMMTKQFDQSFTPSMRERAHELGLSIQEVVTLASLVEKEAQLERDRPVIAGVFLNRLQQGMPLQSCATIQYILGFPKEELSVADTEIPSPYNTYQNKGLPPGPIANPGLAAINAVLYPKSSEYLYFVADKQGAHHFSKTYEEHLATIEAVRK
jgi:UPF0755 protein